MSFFIMGRKGLFLAVCLLLFYFPFLLPVEIVQKPIRFTEKREALTKNYIKKHYGFDVNSVKISPKVIVLHWTGTNSFDASFNTFDHEAYPQNPSEVNVSSHYLVDRDGKIYQLMPTNVMARHVIGLNYFAIGIENVGGENHEENLTAAQVEANVHLIHELRKAYPQIRRVIGHNEYLQLEKTPLWLEKNPAYRNIKEDPGKKFLSEVRDLLARQGRG